MVLEKWTRLLLLTQDWKAHKAELLMCVPEDCAGGGSAVKGEALCARAEARPLTARTPALGDGHTHEEHSHARSIAKHRLAVGCAGNQARCHMGQDAASSQGLALTQINPVGSVGGIPLKQEIWKRLP